MHWTVIVTGASRGFGRAVVRMLVSWVLTARSASDIVDTIKAADPTATIAHSGRLGPLVELNALLISSPAQEHQHLRSQAQPGVTFDVIQGDMGDMTNLTSLIASISTAAMSATQKFQSDKVVLISNAGTLGDLTKRVEDLDDPRVLSDFLNLNVVAPTMLISQVLRDFKDKQIVLVNVSTLLAIQPEQGAVFYCISKAARNMLHRVVAKEHPAEKVKTLNYAPGPMDTEMQREFRENILDPRLRQVFQDMHREGKLVAPEDSANKLARLIIEQQFESGSHIDYFDV